MKILTGKAAMVTGAGQGIGQGIALALAGEGAAVALVGRTRSKLEQTAAVIARRSGKAVVIPCDVTREEEVTAAVTETVGRLGGLHILINNAQEFAFGGLADIDLSSVEAGWQSGPMGTLRAMRAAFPHLRHGGVVVNISSGASANPEPGTGAYAATKSAIEALTRAAALEWASQGVRVNVVVPFVKSPAVEAVLSASPGVEEQVLSQVPLRRWGDAEREIGRAVVFLCGPDAAFITGTSLAVDGGGSYLR